MIGYTWYTWVYWIPFEIAWFQKDYECQSHSYFQYYSDNNTKKSPNKQTKPETDISYEYRWKPNPQQNINKLNLTICIRKYTTWPLWFISAYKATSVLENESLQSAISTG